MFIFFQEMNITLKMISFYILKMEVLQFSDFVKDKILKNLDKGKIMTKKSRKMDKTH